MLKIAIDYIKWNMHSEHTLQDMLNMVQNDERCLTWYEVMCVSI